MRTIKFRTWNKASQTMGHGGICIINSDGTLEATPDVEVMQFTGLLDKNGKEIYEGDVLLIPDEDVVPVTDEGQGPIEPCDHLVPVEFRNGEFGFEIPKTDDGETGWFTFRTWNEIDDVAKLEVIGNIYEHGDLLKP